MTDSRKPDAGCPCMAYQDQLPLYARSARVPDERFIPWRFCPWCGRDSRSPIPAQPSPEQREAEVELLWRWCYALALAGAQAMLKLRNAEQREAGEENVWPAQQEWHEMVPSSHSIFLRAIREAAGVPHDEFLSRVRGERGPMYEPVATELYDRALSVVSPPADTGKET